MVNMVNVTPLPWAGIGRVLRNFFFRIFKNWRVRGEPKYTESKLIGRKV